MENKEGNKKNKRKIKVFEKYTILLFVITLFMGVAYADVSDIKLEVTGQVVAELQDGIFISDIKRTAATGLISEEVKYYKGTTISSRIQLSSTSTSSLNYHVKLYNNSAGKYYFKGIEYIDEAYDNTKIVHVTEGLTPYITTIDGKGTTLEFDLKFKYKDGITVSSIQELNSVLNIVFSDETIDFKVGTTTYKAQSGATWEQFINSNYNTSSYGFKITNKKVCTKAGKTIVVDGKDIKPEDVISKDLKYNIAPVINLDKETINLEIEEGVTGTESITATVENVTADKLTWKVETADSGITLSGTGLTRTITATKAIENAVIKVSYGDYEKTCIVNVSVKASAKKAYEIGDIVKIKNGDVEEEFYVIEPSSESDDTVTLLAKNCIDTENLIQSDNPSNIDFSSDIYWSDYDIETYPYDLVETGVPDPDHYAAYAAYQYGDKLGGSGRLMTYSEASALQGTYDNVLYIESEDECYDYFLGTLWSVYDLPWGPCWTISVVVFDGANYIIGGFDIDDLMAGIPFAHIRPVVTISKSLLSAEETKTISFTIDGVEYQAEEGMTWAEWAETTTEWSVATVYSGYSGYITTIVNTSSQKYICCLACKSYFSPGSVIKECGCGTASGYNFGVENYYEVGPS